MKSPAKLPRRSLMPVLVCLGISFAAQVTPAQCPNRGTVSYDGEVSNSQGKPYQARAITTVVTYGSDGTKRAVATKSNFFRDSRGRIRVERFYDGTEDPSEIVPSDISIHDNCGTFVNLLPARHTGKISKEFFLVKGSDRPYCEEFDLNNLPKPSPEGKFEVLGHKMVDGVEVLGQRTSQYSSVEAKLAGAPPVHIFESWCSKTLDTPMGSLILSEKPKTEITTVISDLRQIEPDPALFEIPEGYTMTKTDQNAQASGTKDSPSSTPAPK